MSLTSNQSQPNITWSKKLIAFVLSVGVNITDNDDLRLQKNLLVTSSLMIMLAGAVWGIIYLLLGEAVTGIIPLFYSAITLVNIIVFAYWRNYRFFRFTQLLLILLLPFLVMVALRGYVQSSMVIIWAFLCPLGALLFEEPKKAWRWFVAYLALIVLGGMLEPFYAGPNGLSPNIRNAFFVMNLAAVSTITFVLLNYFVRQRNSFQLLAQERLQAELEAERHRSMAQMVAGVAHELNTPLGVVNTAVDMIEGEINELGPEDITEETIEDIREAARLAGRNISRAHKLVENFKKISVNQLTDNKETVDLFALVLDILYLFKINARQANLEITVNNNLPDNQNQWVGYPGHLSQVLLNLLTNIQRYAYPDESGDLVEISLNAGLDNFVLTIEDFGQGIAHENISQIFTPFFTTGRGQGGTGLGLSIVHNIVTGALHGNITVDSTPGKGTCFTIILPQVL